MKTFTLTTVILSVTSLVLGGPVSKAEDGLILADEPVVSAGTGTSGTATSAVTSLGDLIVSGASDLLGIGQRAKREDGLTLANEPVVSAGTGTSGTATSAVTSLGDLIVTGASDLLGIGQKRSVLFKA